MAPSAVPDETMEVDSSSIKPPPGVIIPPKEFRPLLEKTAAFISRRGEDFERRVIEQAASNIKLQFILPDNPYQPYYQWRKSENAEGRGFETEGADTSTKFVKPVAKKGPTAPPEFHFSARMPTISAVDLEVVKLTALFVAKNGRSWMTALSQREARNFQFDFLRPQHSFNQFFQRLVDQYTELLTGDSVDGGRPQKKRMAELEHNVSDKYHMLERARQRAGWVKHQEAQKVKKEEEAEAEKIAYQEIDWHDFVVVGTIEFGDEDEEGALPPPRSLNDLQSASLEQKAAMSLAPTDRRLEEAMPDHAEFFSGYQPPPAQIPNPQSYAMPPPMPFAPSPQPPPQSASPAPYAPPRSAQEVEEEAHIAERMAERERAAQAQAAAKATGPMRIRNDYVPRAQARRQAANTVLCQICKQQIPSEEYEQHVRIEMLDPRWREQTRIAAQRSSTTNLSTADVANNLKRLASQRSDVFDPVTGQSLSEEEAARRKRIELNSYDGSSTAQGGAAGGGGGGAAGAGAYGATDGKDTNVQEQIRKLQNKYGGQ